MHEVPAIECRNVSKHYRLYSKASHQVLDVFGLGRLLGKEPRYRTFRALDDVCFEVARGERVGVIGRNGAGKTTLLKLLTGNFRPTEGEVSVTGTVQALMSVGLGFHPEFSGYENIRSSLTYNGMVDNALEEALEDVIEFAELGQFLYQPIKTYSLGMRARLQFAAATAITPDILIIDEVLGAGDAYFSAKSAARMKSLTSGGCTLLLVSHSMQQILQFCSRAVWLDGGRIRLQGDALPVVKAYEEHIEQLREEQRSKAVVALEAKPSAPAPRLVVDQKWFREGHMQEILPGTDAPEVVAPREPGPEAGAIAGPASAGGISRWPGDGAVKIAHVKVTDAEGNEKSVVRTGDEFRISIEAEAKEAGDYPIRYLILLFTPDGRPLSRHLSETQSVSLGAGERCCLTLVFPEVRLGKGDFVFSVAIYRDFDVTKPQESHRYDLLSRSFQFSVKDRIDTDPSLFHHPAKWV